MVPAIAPCGGLARPPGLAQRGGITSEKAQRVTDARGLPDATELARRSAILQLPTWMAGGNPAEFGEQCRWRLEAADPAAGAWRVRLNERVRRKAAHLVQVRRLATAANAEAAGSYARLRRLAGAPGLGSSVSPQRVQAELDRLARDRPGDIAALMDSGALATSTTPRRAPARHRAASTPGPVASSAS